RDIEGKIKTVTIKRNALGEIFLFFTCEVPDSQTSRVMTGKSAGFDFGLTTFLTSSDGSDIKTPLPYKQAEKAIARAQKNRSRKKKGSNNRRKASKDVARNYKKVANQRHDYLFKLAIHLATKYDVLC